MREEIVAEVVSEPVRPTLYIAVMSVADYDECWCSSAPMLSKESALQNAHDLGYAPCFIVRIPGSSPAAPASGREERDKVIEEANKMLCEVQEKWRRAQDLLRRAGGELFDDRTSKAWHDECDELLNSDAFLSATAPQPQVKI